MSPSIEFALTPDRAASRRLRRLLASDHPHLGLIVGTWLELLELLRTTHLLPQPAPGWDDALAHAMSGVPTPFWADSLAIAPSETRRAVEAVLTALIEARTPGQPIDPDASTALSDRARRHLADLAALQSELGDALPPDLALIRDLLAAPADQALHWIRIHHHPDLPQLDPWQRALVARFSQSTSQSASLLENDAGEIEGHFVAALAPSPSAPADCSLGHLQRNLFSASASPAPLDNTLQWLGVRDELEGLEVAAGLIHLALQDDASLHPSDFALLLPADASYRSAARSVFATAGVPLSGLDCDAALRDLGVELVLHYLKRAQGRAAAMVSADLVASPLMPWPLEVGMSLAQQVVNGSHKPHLPGDALPEWGAMLETLVARPRDRAQMAAALQSLSDNLRAGAPELEPHLERARACIAAMLSLLAELAGSDSIPWQDLVELAIPSHQCQSHDLDLPREGVAVFDEDQEAWRPVRCLIVLGCSAGRYPRSAPTSPVFSEDDLRILRDELGYEIDTQADVLQRGRALFERQLAMASERVEFMVPRRDASGGRLGCSSSLTFMARLFDGVEDADGLVLDLDGAEACDRAQGVPAAAPGEPMPPRTLASDDLGFGRNLLEGWCDDAGAPRPLSPSSLDTLMVSPLAWLFGRSGIEPREWAAEELDPALRGTLAHAVFEELFAEGAALPDASTIEAKAPELLAAAIDSNAHFLAADAWHVERLNLVNEIQQAARTWSEMLAALNGRIVATERKLVGDLEGTPISGTADAIVALPDGALYVVDYKKSSSIGREARMTAGYDSQASLYRIMIETGEQPDAQLAATLAERDRSAPIGILYFNMNDRMALADVALGGDGNITRLKPLGTNISDGAMELIAARLEQLAAGRMRLNRSGDEEYFDKRCGIKPYAFDDTPLIRLFIRDADSAGEGE